VAGCQYWTTVWHRSTTWASSTRAFAGQLLGVGERLFATPVRCLSAPWLEEPIKELKAAGYSVRLALADMPPEQTARSPVTRFHRGGRLQQPEHVRRLGMRLNEPTLDCDNERIWFMDTPTSTPAKTNRELSSPAVKDDLPHLADELEADIRREIAHLGHDELAEMVRSVRRLVQAFEPEQIYVFGSHARGTPTTNSDVDLLVLVASSGEPSYRRGQAAYAAVGAHQVPLDILVMTRAEFDARLSAAASLPATVARQGRTLYATAAA